MTPQEMNQRIDWLGHDGFRINGEKTVYIDPFEIKGGGPADLILITHDHYDHCSVADVEKITGPHTVIITEADSAKKLKGDVKVMKPGETLEISGVKIEATPAYNTNKKFHPKGKNWLGFVVEMDRVRIYHAGDTDFIDEMRDIKTHIALLPVSGTYVMTAQEAVQAALAIRPEIAVPMHYGAIVGGRVPGRDL